MISVHLWILAAALVVDAIVGDPRWIWRRVPHPVAWLGALVGGLDRWLNRPDQSDAARKALGVAAVVLLLTVAIAAGIFLECVFRAIPFGWIGSVLVAAVFLAGRSLYDHVAAVASPTQRADWPKRAGPWRISSAAIRKASTRPGSAAPRSSCWRRISPTASSRRPSGSRCSDFPGLLAYKAINTADSMIGHRNERYRAFGWAAARLDDLVNLPASRLAGFLIAAAAPLAGGSSRTAVSVMIADAGKHRSPNAGWPEAAMAAALGIAIAGPRRYPDHIVDDAFINAAGRTAAPGDIARALRVYLGAWTGLFLVAALAGLLGPGLG